ncbi:RING finger and WD repeat domain-containing protein 3 [Coemansia sp. RSA 988]|nr:RING finger and WD repeat domain-containing protein 3 [Coemansia sp. RSA 988]
MSDSLGIEESQSSPPSLSQVFAGTLAPQSRTNASNTIHEQPLIRTGSGLSICSATDSVQTEAISESEHWEDGQQQTAPTLHRPRFGETQPAHSERQNIIPQKRPHINSGNSISTEVSRAQAGTACLPILAERQSRFFTGASGSSAIIEGTDVGAAPADIAGTASADSSRISGGDSDSDDFARPVVPPQQLSEQRPGRPPPIPEDSIGHEASTNIEGSAEHVAADDRNVCSVCLEPWSISGPHRVISLKCGHLFGQSCAKKWLRKSSLKRFRQGTSSTKVSGKCPECNQRAELRDIRPIYARSITAVDGGKLYEMQSELKRLNELKAKLEGERMEFCLKYNQMHNEVVRLRKELELSFQRGQWLQLENSNLTKRVSELCGSDDHHSSLPLSPRDDLSLPDACDILADDQLLLLDEDRCKDKTGANSTEKAAANNRARSTYLPRMRLRATIPIAAQAMESSRLLVIHPHEQLVYASYSRPSLHLHTLAQIDIHNPNAPAYVLDLPHKAEIRGAEVSPHASGARYMLTASQDQTAAVCALGYGSSLATVSTAAAGKRPSPMLAAKISARAPCWSCAWDPCDVNICYIGTTSSRVMAFDLRRANMPLHTWDGPRDGADMFSGESSVSDTAVKLNTGYSPIHGIVAMPPDHYGGRLVVANSAHLFALPPLPDRVPLADAAEQGTKAPSAAWVQLTENAGSSARSCYSVSFDAALGCIAASFRTQNSETNMPATDHQLFDVGSSRDEWRRRRRHITVSSTQTKMARSTLFSYQNNCSPDHRQGLFCAGVEAMRMIRAWDVAGRSNKEVLSLGDVTAAEDIVDVKGWQWGEDANLQQAMFASLTNTTVRLYDVR